ncbi:MAG: RNA 2',3'-cyclic phosphodiesterase [Gemmatimonadota bacterium]
MRAFIALPCPPRLRSALTEALGAWRGRGVAVRWSDPEKIHLTLRFLGDHADEDGLGRLEGGLARTAAASRPLVVRPDAIGAFPGWGRPRVLWLRLAEDGALADLAGRVEEAAREAGFPAEDRAFSPHLTLGRVKAPRGLDETLADLRAWRPDTGLETLDELIVYRSELGPGGARHEAIGRHRLGGAP